MSLRQCIDDADGICVFGCQTDNTVAAGNLKFCHYFNNPNGRQLGNLFFRNCNLEADQAAEQTYHQWIEQDVIRSHAIGSVKLHFKNLTKCHPELWKILACTLHLQPCLSEWHNTEICR